MEEFLKLSIQRRQRELDCVAAGKWDPVDRLELGSRLQFIKRLDGRAETWRHSRWESYFVGNLRSYLAYFRMWTKD